MASKASRLTEGLHATAEEERKRKALRALERLAARRQHLPLIDAVEVVRAIRSEDENREAD